jgi:hypothetical protein
MLVNFRTRKITRGARKLARTPTLINKNKNSDPIILISLHFLDHPAIMESFSITMAKPTSY